MHLSITGFRIRQIRFATESPTAIADRCVSPPNCRATKIRIRDRYVAVPPPRPGVNRLSVAADVRIDFGTSIRACPRYERDIECACSLRRRRLRVPPRTCRLRARPRAPCNGVGVNVVGQQAQKQREAGGFGEHLETSGWPVSPSPGGCNLLLRDPATYVGLLSPLLSLSRSSVISLFCVYYSRLTFVHKWTSCTDQKSCFSAYKRRRCVSFVSDLDIIESRRRRIEGNVRCDVMDSDWERTAVANIKSQQMWHYASSKFFSLLQFDIYV